MNVLFLLFIALFIVLLISMCNKKEGMGGYGVTSALHFYDRIAYCDPGNLDENGSYAGGCFLPHRVIL